MSFSDGSAEHLVVGGGISGIACARALQDAGRAVVVRDRGHRLGGRMAVRTVDGRPVDVGAAYFTASHWAFREVVERLIDLELVRPWTDTFHLGSPEGLLGTHTGPMRYAATLGLRSLVEELAVGLALQSHDEVSAVGPGPVADDVAYASVALALPGPQALDLLAESLVEERAAADGLWEPCISVVATFDARAWPELDGVFVNDSPVLRFVADDGRRRGDDAPVLVAHVHPVLAAAHLDDPDSVIPPALAELSAVLGISADPASVFAKRWSLARPTNPRPEPFWLGAGRIGLCGDAWHGASRIESAFLSGRALGRALAQLDG